MIDKNVVTRIVDEWLEGKDYFLVDVTVSPDDKIVVEIDHAEGVWIDDCVELSRYIESKLDRDIYQKVIFTFQPLVNNPGYYIFIYHLFTIKNKKRA